MEYFQIELLYDPAGIDTDTLAVLLTAQDFDSFEETETGIIAYIPAHMWHLESFQEWLRGIFEGKITLLKAAPLEEKNWNEVWESNFPAVTVAGKCRIRAPFHDPDPSYPLEVVIEPKMSFGTAHHETTSMMIELQLNMDWKGKSVLDMGCGTGILAIIAAKLGAKNLLAVDNDPWAYENSLENIERNGTRANIEVKLGDAKDLTGRFDVVIANINRNILLNDLQAYVNVMHPGSVLMLSGFYREDLPAIQQKAESIGMTYNHHLHKNNWVAVVFNL